MLTVSCVLSKSKENGPVYNRSHVSRLYKMVSQHMRQPYRFVCIDDSISTGFWAKVDLFRPGRFKGRVLYIDLDSTIIGNLDDLANHPSPFSIVRNFPEIKEPNKSAFNSSVMSWDAGAADHLYTYFYSELMSIYPGDQDWISEGMPNANTFPEEWVASYKVRKFFHMKTIPKDTRVICYHGKPKPWDLPFDDLEGFVVASF